MQLPTQITRDHVNTAVKALGITDLYGIVSVNIDARKETITVTTRVTGQNGDYLIVNGDCAYQEHTIPVVKADAS